MDDQSGKIYGFQSKEFMKLFSEQFEQLDHSMTEINNTPDPYCPKCHGQGSIKSKPYTKDGHMCFYRPCKCTNGRGEQ